MAGDQFFLDAADEADDAKFRATKREAVSVIPLIDGIATFKAMEVAMASATTSVHLAVWTMKADLPLQAKGDANKALLAAGYEGLAVSTWSELLAAIASHGVEVCVSMTDFDAILQSTLHENCWRAYSVLRAAAAKAKATTLQVMCARHDAHFSPPFLLEFGIMSPALNKIVTRLNSLGATAGVTELNTQPGLWQFIDFNPTTKTFSRSSTTVVIFPASHHQKIAIVDGHIGFCGGIDPQPGRIDSPAHSNTWHDTHVQVNGPLASDLERNFVARWNSDAIVFNSFVAATSTASGKTLKAAPVTPITATPGQSAATFGPATGQLLRTIASTTVSQALPVVIRKDIEEAYENAISKAQNFIYIENQYFRDHKLVTWLSATPNNVVVILVVPIAPEEFAQAGGPDRVTKKGMFEENANITALRAALPGRFEAFSMIQRNAASKTHTTNMFKSFQIYVHSKTLIIDDEFAMIGSANTNPRSHRVDTEANIAWYEPIGVKALRMALWNEQLGSPSGMDAWMAPTFLSHWNTIATANEGAAKPPAGRSGFIVHHSTTEFPGDNDPDVPKEYTELTDQDPAGVVLV